jgi:cyclic-di-GMP-binding biofilm dispersal mediator protein
MDSFSGKQVLVVGTTGAIGSALTNLFVTQGVSVFGTASTEASSTRLRADLPMRLILDLENPASIEAVAGYLASTVNAIDGIVLASGLVAFGELESTPASVTERLMKVNFSGQVELVRQLLPLLRNSAAAGKEPFIVSMSGVVSEQPMAGLSSYSASKTALFGFASAASKELRRQGIRWIDARPGHTESGLANRAIFGTAPNFGTGLSVEEVAGRILEAISSDEKDLPSSSFKL